ncbi:MAG TPA: heavy-metal-associated domain-containing protein [Patescibacteria group bacterium]
MKKINFKIKGFHCDACVKLATMKLKKITGVDAVEVEPDGQATLEVEREIGFEEIEKALDGTGYGVEM